MIVRRRLALYAPSGGGGPPDTTPPTLTGTVTVGTVTSTSIQVSHPAGSDDVAVTAYEYSTDGTSWTSSGSTATTYTFTGLTASTSYTLRVRAKDAAGNVSTPALSATQSTSAATAGTITLGPFASAGTLWPVGTVVYYEWQQGGRIGSAPTSTTRGNITISTAGMVPLTGLPSGAGLGIVAKRNSAATDDAVGYQAGTVA